ncbi:carbohydrate porin [Desulfosediminicola sp.]|uniref:carbohydrate porin n=1 Tax=Desulfosediminicola sp. TaxID=2886825 RepID=UPI003AF27BC0
MKGFHGFPLLCVLFFLLFFPVIALGGPYSFEGNLTGDWGGVRNDLHDAGLDVGLSYTAEPAALLGGGIDTDSTYLHNINAEVKVDLDKVVGIPGTTFLMKVSSREGDNLGEEYIAPAASPDGRYIYGEYFNKPQEAFGGQTTKLTNFQFTTRITDEWSVDIGRLVMNDLFLRSDLYCNFMNNGICGSPKGVFTPYALNAYPDATAGIHTRYRVSDMVDAKFGIFDGGWTKQNSNGLDWELGLNGAAFTGEVHLFFDRAEQGGTQNVIKVGANYHTGDFTNFKTGGESDGNLSLWLLLDWMLTREPHDPAQGLAFFGSLVVNTDEEIAALPVSSTLGFLYEGLFPGRDRDKLGLIFIHSDHSKYNTYTHDFVSDLQRGNELVVELTYNFVLRYGVQLMPTFQYIINPNGSEDISDATVLGLKFNLNL